MLKLIPLLISETGLNELDLRRIIRNAPQRYKTFRIKKRDGNFRLISQPAREVKILQRIVDDKILKHLPIHDSAKAYREGCSIKDNALAHVNNGPIYKFDFKDFFPSIYARDWIKYCHTNEIFGSDSDLQASTNILFYQGRANLALRLAIGAPSSPRLSNVLMHRFDVELTELLRDSKVTYTRYADDLTFSAPRTGYLNNVERTLRSLIREIKSPSLSLNEVKIVRSTMKFKRQVTGLILTNDHCISVGYERKRNIRAAVHHALLEKLSLDERARLGGLLAFVENVEPEFFSKLSARYGQSLLKDLKRAGSLSRKARGV